MRAAARRSCPVCRELRHPDEFGTIVVQLHVHDRSGAAREYRRDACADCVRKLRLILTGSNDAAAERRAS